LVETVVMKCGGSVLEELSDTFIHSLKEMQKKNNQIVIVHGGGPHIGSLLSKLNIEFEFIDGLRKTNEDVLEVTEMVLAGKVNKQLVTLLNQAGLKAIGLSGCDGNLLEAVPVNEKKLGFVGEVQKCNVDLITTLLESGYIPVIAPIGIGADGKKYNINADTAAGKIASLIGAKQLIFITDVAGILKDGNLLETATPEMIDQLIADRIIHGGMIPKVKAALHALTGHLQEVMIVSGKIPLFNENGKMVGTKIMKQLEAV
jgi:acetylglutamate kinase